MASKTGFRSIPTAQGSPANVRALVENLQVLLGQAGNGNKRALLREDFAAISEVLGFTFNPKTGAIAPSAGGGSTVAAPPVPQNVQASGAFTNIIVTWDKPSFVGYAYAEVYRSTIDDFGTAVRVATTLSAIYADPVGYGQTYYYWIRFVNTNNVIGPLNNTAGTVASTALNISTVIAQLSDEIDITLLSQSLRDQSNFLDAQWGVKSVVGELSGGVGFVNDGLTTQFFINAETFAVLAPDDSFINPFIIQGGVTYIDEAMIRAASIQVAQIEQLTVDDIVGFNAAFVLATIGTGSITNAYIGNVIESDNYVAGVSGWHIDKSGFAEFPTLFADFIQVDDINVVSTLMLQGQAVTIPTAAFTSAAVAVNNSLATTLLQTVTFTTSGNPVHINCSCVARSSGGGPFGMKFFLFKTVNGGGPTLLYLDDATLGGTAIFAQREENIGIAVVDPSPGVDGDVIEYTFYARRHPDTNPGLTAANRTILAVEHKETGS